MSKRTVIITVVALAAVTGVGAAFVVPALAASDKQEKTEQRIDVATDKVTRGDLTERVRAGGKLAYANSHAAGTTLAGTITWLPGVGTIITRGGDLLRIDDQPVTVLFGDLPAWRAFGPDMADGRDVKQLEENLRELGFFDGEPDEEFTWRTAEAIRDWQESRGLERTGELPLGSIVFTSGDVRVGAINSPVGSASSAEALTLTDPHQQITIDLDADLAAIVAEGATVSVSLPGGSAVEATITSIGAPVQKEGENGDKVMKIPLVLTPKELPPGPSDVTVSATFTRTLASNVLRVPVLALLAGPDSKTQVEVMAGKKTRTVDVTLGAFGDGFVEITGGDITEGDTVVVAQ